MRLTQVLHCRRLRSTKKNLPGKPTGLKNDRFIPTTLMPGETLEATTGFEPVHKGFADLSLTTWVRRRSSSGSHCRRKKKPRHLVGLGAAGPLYRGSEDTEAFGAITVRLLPRRAERETGFEPATSTLARLRSTN
jgi:hypothetical protein